MKTILLKFAGPMQSWGTNSNFETRHTDFYPSKSGIIGFMAAGLGYKRNEDEKIKKLNELSFGVRIDQPGNLLKDYHIAKKYKKDDSFDRTYVTNRYYLEDAVFVVAISHNDDDFMEMIAKSLKNPWFQTYMGRRSLPPSADFFIEMNEKTVLKSLKETEWKASDWYKKKNKKNIVKLEIYADANEFGQKNYIMRKDKVISLSNAHRRFAYRNETVFCVEICNQEYDYSTNHDIFNNVGD